MKRLFSLILCAAALISIFAFPAFAVDAYDQNDKFLESDTAFISRYVNGTNDLTPVSYSSGGLAGYFNYFVPGAVRCYITLRMPASANISITGFTPIESFQNDETYKHVTYMNEGSPNAYSIPLAINSDSWFYVENCYVVPEYSGYRITPSSPTIVTRYYSGEYLQGSNNNTVSGNIFTSGQYVECQFGQLVHPIVEFSFDIPTYGYDHKYDYAKFQILSSGEYDVILPQYVPYEIQNDILMLDLTKHNFSNEPTLTVTIQYYGSDRVDTMDSGRLFSEDIFVGVVPLVGYFAVSHPFSLSSIYQMIVGRLEWIRSAINNGFSAIGSKIDSLINGSSSQQGSVDEFGSTAESQGSEINDALSGLESVPDIDVDDIDLDLDLDSEANASYGSLLGVILGNSIFFQLMMMVMVFALAGYILFGKR